MKNFKMNLVLFLAAVLMMGGNAMAQAEVTWDHYGIGFYVPEDFGVEASNAQEFSAGNNNVFISVFPWHDAAVNENDLAEGVVQAATEMQYDQLHDVVALQLNDYVGYAVEGSIQGSNAMVMLLLDPQTSTNMVVSVTYTPGWDDVAAAICEGIHAY